MLLCSLLKFKMIYQTSQYLIHSINFVFYKFQFEFYDYYYLYSKYFHVYLIFLFVLYTGNISFVLHMIHSYCIFFHFYHIRGIVYFDLLRRNPLVKLYMCSCILFKTNGVSRILNNKTFPCRTGLTMGSISERKFSRCEKDISTMV